MKHTKGFKKLTTLKGWQRLFKILNKKERIIFLVFLLLTLTSLIFFISSFYYHHTEIAPKKGGIYTEGIIGSPRYINPLYAPGNDVDRDLAQLVYAGLTKYDAQGEVVLDLAANYEIIENGKIFEFYLKEDLFWSDGEPLTAEDIIFTIKTIQNPSFKSPIRASWLGVKVEQISELGIRFELSNPSFVFLENTTLGILPKHIWENISDQNFSLSIYNLKPIGAGPYKIKNVNLNKEGDVKSLELSINPYYHAALPYITNLNFIFFENESKLTSALNANQIDGVFLNSLEKPVKHSFAEYHLTMPTYFAVFFNTEQSKILANKEVRKALNYATNKEALIQQVLNNQAKIVNSPILPDLFNFNDPTTTYTFDSEKAKTILDQAGFPQQENGLREKTTKKEPAFQFKSDLQLGSQSSEVQELQKCLAKDSDVFPNPEITGYFGEKTKTAVIKFQEKYKEEILTPSGLTQGNGKVLKSTRKKLNELCAAPSQETETLTLTLTTINQPALVTIANLIKDQWEEIGVQLEIEIVESAILTEDIIRPRNYEAILFGQGLGTIIDPFPFWHSSQTKDPGLNIALYENKEADKLLERARQNLNLEERKADLEKFQDILLAEAPAIFLYSPSYLYLVSDKIKGVSDKTVVDPSKRFLEINQWYIKTKRIWS